MDREIFDALTRRLSSGTSRRGILGLLIGTVIGGLHGSHNMAEAKAGDSKKKRRRRRKKQRRHDTDNGQEQALDPDPVQDQCVPLTPVFDMPPATCASSSECCDGGTCCTFIEIDGPYTGCFDLLTNTTICGLSCETIMNCLNSDQQCVNGQCVDPDPE